MKTIFEPGLNLIRAAAVLICAGLVIGLFDLYTVYAVLMCAGCLALIAGFGVMTFAESRRK